MNNINKNNFNFIVGIGRSGTTLLMSLLNAHPNIQATPEINFFNFFSSQWKGKTHFSENDYTIIKNYLNSYKSNNHSGFDFNFDKFKAKKSTSFKQLYENFYDCFIYGETHKLTNYFFDKNPINSLYLKKIIDVFPEAKFIFITRDARASYLSRKQKQKKRSTDIYFNSYRWVLYNNEVLKFATLYPEKFYLLKYENLVTDPEKQLKQMAAFFDFTYDEKMLLFHENVIKNSLMLDSEKLNSRAFTKYSDLSHPINTNRLHTWRNELTTDEIYIIDTITSKTALKLGYEKVPVSGRFSKINFLKGKLKTLKTVLYDKLVSRLPLTIKITRLKT